LEHRQGICGLRWPVDIVRLCCEQYGADNADSTMAAAAQSGHLDIVFLCKDEYGATDVNHAMVSAAKY